MWKYGGNVPFNGNLGVKAILTYDAVLLEEYLMTGQRLGQTVSLVLAHAPFVYCELDDILFHDDIEIVIYYNDILKQEDAVYPIFNEIEVYTFWHFDRCSIDYSDLQCKHVINRRCGIDMEQNCQSTQKVFCDDILKILHLLKKTGHCIGLFPSTLIDQQWNYDSPEPYIAFMDFLSDVRTQYVNSTLIQQFVQDLATMFERGHFKTLVDISRNTYRKSALQSDHLPPNVKKLLMFGSW
jgi:hypothetical protein